MELGSLFKRPQVELPPGATRTEAMVRAGETSPVDPLLGQQQSGEIFQDVMDPTVPDPAGHRTPERNINIDRLEAEDEVVNIMDRVSRQTENAGYQRKTMAEMKGELDITDDEVVDRLVGKKSKDRDYALKGAQLTRAREIMVTSGTRLKDSIVDVADRLRTNQVDDIELLDLQRQMLLHTGFQSAVQKEVREAARTLKQLQEIAKPFNTLQMDAMMNAHGGRDTIAAKIKEIARAVDPNASELDQLAAMNKAAKKLGGMRFMNQVVGYRTVQLLSSPTTHARNIIGNTLTALSAPVERMAAAGVSAVRGGDTEFGEAYQLLLGTFGSFTDAIRLAKKTYQTGDTLYGTTKLDEQANVNQVPSDVSQYTNNPLRKGWDWVYNKLMLPGKALLAEDEFFKTLAFNGEMRAQAYRTARSEGRSGQELTDRIDELLAGPNQQKILDKVNDDLLRAGDDGDPTPLFQATMAAEERVFYDMYTRSTQFAQYQTFTDPLKTDFAKGVGKLQRNPFVKLVVPFYRTPVNILAYATERSILGPITKQFREDWAAGGARRDLAEARMAMGSTTSLVIGGMVWNGMLTGTGPSNYELRKTYEADGWQRSSIKMGSKWVSYQGFDPFSTQMAVLTNMVDAYRYATTDKQRENRATIVIVAFAEAVKDRSFMQGISDFIDMFDRMKEGGMSRFGTTLGPSFLPASGLARNLNKNMPFIGDKTKRNTRGPDWLTTVQNEMKMYAPYFFDPLPPQVDMFGKEQKYNEPYGFDPVSPFMFSQFGEYTAATELSRNAVPVSQVKPIVSLKGIKIDTMIMGDDRGPGWVYYELQKTVGQYRESIVTDMINSEEYKNATPGAPQDVQSNYITQGDLLQQALQKGREVGVKHFFGTYEDQITQMVNKGAVEVSIWPTAPSSTAEAMKNKKDLAAVPLPKLPEF